MGDADHTSMRRTCVYVYTVRRARVHNGVSTNTHSREATSYKLAVVYILYKFIIIVVT